MANAGSRQSTHPRVTPRGDIGDRVRKRRATPDVEGRERHQLRRRRAVSSDVDTSGLTSAIGPAVRGLFIRVSARSLHARADWAHARKQLLLNLFRRLDGHRLGRRPGVGVHEGGPNMTGSNLSPGCAAAMMIDAQCCEGPCGCCGLPRVPKVRRAGRSPSPTSDGAGLRMSDP
jgi:hypothetical protein